MIGNILNQATNILSGSPKDLESTTTGTTGSAAGQDAAQWGIDRMQGHIAGGPGTFTGRHPGTQGPNAAQTQQYNILQGMYGSVPGGVSGAVGNMTPQQIAAMNRRGGPHAGYTSPYTGQMLAGVDQDMKTAMQMAANTEGDLAQQYRAGGPSSVRSGLERFGAMGDIGLKAAQMKRGIRDDAFTKGMGWQREDEQDRIANLQNRNREARMFGGLRSNVAQADINNKFNLANQYGLYGQGQQQQQNLADQFKYGEFNRMQNWAPNFLTGYNTGVGQVPWQTSQTQYGSGPSDLQNIFGAAVGLGGAYLMG